VLLEKELAMRSDFKHLVDASKYGSKLLIPLLHRIEEMEHLLNEFSQQCEKTLNDPQTSGCDRKATLQLFGYIIQMRKILK
jgi:hypothetical protein